MPSERITLHRTNVDKTEVIEQYPKTIVSQVYDFDNGKFLNETLNGVTQQLAQTDENLIQRGVNVKADFGAVGGGLIDDTQAFINLINYINEQSTVTKVEIPNDMYLITGMLPDITSSVEIICNNSEFIWKGRNITGNYQRDKGLFNFRGTVDTIETTVVSMDLFRTPASLNHVVSSFFTDSVLTLPSGHGFAVGDYLLLSITTGEQNTSTIEPKDEKILKVTKVNGNDVYINYWSPFDYKSKTYVAKVKKCYPLKVITINDFIINDQSGYTPNYNVNVTNPERDKFISGITFKYCDTIRLKNINGKNTHFPVTSMTYCSNIQFDRGYLETPSSVGPGEGYLSQFINCVDIECKDLHAESARHVTDFTGCAFFELKNSKGISMYGSSHQQHGQYEHNGYYEYIEGSFNGNSGLSFGSACSNIQFKNCNILLRGSYMKNISVEGGIIKLVSAITDIKISNSEVEIVLNTIHDTRSSEEERNLILLNCNTKFSEGTRNSGHLYNFGKISIRHGSIQGVLQTFNLLYIDSCPDLLIEGVEIKNSISIQSWSESVDMVVMLKNITGNYEYKESGLYSVRNVNNCKLNLQIDGLVMKRIGSTQGQLLRLPRDNYTNFKLISSIKNLMLDGFDVAVGNFSANDFCLAANNIIENGVLTITTTNNILDNNKIL